MRITVDLGILSLFTTPIAVCDITNGLSYRQNFRYVHLYEEYGLLILYDIIRSKGRGAPKIRYELSSFGKSFLEHFQSLEQ